MQSETEISPAKSRTSGSSSLRNAAWRRFLLRLEQTWVCCFLLVIAGIIVRLPALQGQPVWDDPFLIRDNPFIKSPVLILESFRHSLLPDSFSPHYRPLQTISYCFDYLIWNADAFGFHLSNLLLHVGSGVLLYFLLLRLLAPWAEGFSKIENKSGDGCTVLSGGAFLIALLWMVHPVHSAVVDYISGRADSLAFVFACSAWLFYFRAKSTPSAAGSIAPPVPCPPRPSRHGGLRRPAGPRSHHRPHRHPRPRTSHRRRAAAARCRRSCAGADR